MLEFLNGHYDNLLKRLENQMMEAAERMEYEKAAEYRDLLSSVKKVAQKQKITSSSMEDRDIIAMAMNDTDAVVQVFFVREGKLIGRDHFGIRIGAEKEIPPDPYQLCEAVLRRNSVSAKRAVGAAGAGRYGGH